MSDSSGGMSVFQCIGVVNRNLRGRRRVIQLTIVERVMDDCTKFITEWSL